MTSAQIKDKSHLDSTVADLNDQLRQRTIEVEGLKAQLASGKEQLDAANRRIAAIEQVPTRVNPCDRGSPLSPLLYYPFSRCCSVAVCLNRIHRVGICGVCVVVAVEFGGSGPAVRS